MLSPPARGGSRLAPWLLVLWSTLAPAQATYVVAPWQGEYFDRQQGGIFVKVLLQGFPASAQTQFLTSGIQITFYNLLRKRSYVVNHSPRDVAGAPKEIWKLPSGKYAVRSVVMVDTSGVKRVFEPRVDDQQRTVVVKRQCLSNLGLWALSPAGAGGLAVRFGMVPNSYGEDGDRRESSVAAVIDGFTGLLQAKIGGKAVLEGAETNYEAGHELRATLTITRQISMFFKLNLFRHNVHAAAVSRVLGVYDASLRRCYTDRLEVNDALKGEVKFTFLLSKATGTMAKLKHTGGSANDPKLAQCIYYELAQIQFPVHENMVGELTYIYDVK